MTASFSDEELVGRVQNGEILAYEVLVRRWEMRLLHFAQRILRDKFLAEEVVQDTFFKVYQTIDRVDTGRKFSTYLFEITKNTAISALRKMRPEVSLDPELVGDDGGGMMEKAARLEESSRVQEAVGLLGQKYQKIVRLYYFEDLSYGEIGKKLRLPLNTVRTHLRRGKGQLRRILGERR